MNYGSPGNDSAKNREFSRITTLLPLAVRVISSEEWGISRARIFGEAIYSEYSTLPEISDTHLSMWLKTINAKLDTIMNILTLSQAGFDSLPPRSVTISASGMAFLQKDDIPADTCVEIKVLLFALSPVAAQIYGKVLTVKKQDDQYKIAVKFSPMDDQIRNEIVRFVFEKEREILREKKEEKGY
ncbi:MAG: PilZ domain-containing protein [Syntrophobacterales bacterium]|jgi:hypothetical protein|nr:PilZ domain-containing protein [Syntrophobacterales bacterium]